MARDLDILLSRRNFSRIEIETHLSYVIQEICFKMLSPLSSVIYRGDSEKRKEKYNSICNYISEQVNESAKQAVAAKTYEDFITCVMSVPTSVYDKIHTPEGVIINTPAIELELEEGLKTVFDRIIKKERKKCTKRKVKGSNEQSKS